MKTLVYARLQLGRLLLRPRALLALPVMFFIAYRSANAVLTLAATYGLTANVWDALFYALSSADTVYLALGLLFLYLLGDLSAETRFGQAWMLRLGSRSLWWRGKILTLMAGGLLFTALTVIVLFVWSAIRLPWQDGWSSMILAGHTIEIGLPYDATDTTPLSLLLQHLSLLFLGWVSLGLLGMIAGLTVRRRFVGPIASLAALLSGYVGNSVARQPVVFPWGLLVSYHLEYTPSWTPVRMVPFEYSVVYWLAWLLVLGLVGLVLARRLDDPGVRIG